MSGTSYLCEYCCKFYSSPKKLEKHQESHALRQTFNCPECGEFFKTDYQLKQHARKHKYLELKKCKLCSFRVRCPGNMAYHLENSHQGTKPFSCQQCRARFAFAVELNAHVASHEVRSMFLCTFCCRSFSQPLNLSLHIARQHDVLKMFKFKGVSAELQPFMESEAEPYCSFNSDLQRGRHLYLYSSKDNLKYNFTLPALSHFMLLKYPHLGDHHGEKVTKAPRSGTTRKKRRPAPFRKRVAEYLSNISIALIMKDVWSKFGARKDPQRQYEYTYKMHHRLSLAASNILKNNPKCNYFDVKKYLPGPPPSPPQPEPLTITISMPSTSAMPQPVESAFNRQAQPISKFKFPIPSLDPKSYQVLSGCSHEDVTAFVEKFSVLLVRKYFLGNGNPLETGMPLYSHNPPTLYTLPEADKKYLADKLMTAQRARYERIKQRIVERNSASNVTAVPSNVRVPCTSVQNPSLSPRFSLVTTPLRVNTSIPQPSVHSPLQNIVFNSPSGNSPTNYILVPVQAPKINSTSVASSNLFLPLQTVRNVPKVVQRAPYPPPNVTVNPGTNTIMVPRANHPCENVAFNNGSGPILTINKPVPGQQLVFPTAGLPPVASSPAQVYHRPIYANGTPAKKIMPNILRVPVSRAAVTSNATILPMSPSNWQVLSFVSSQPSLKDDSSQPQTNIPLPVLQLNSNVGKSTPILTSKSKAVKIPKVERSSPVIVNIASSSYSVNPSANNKATGDVDMDTPLKKMRQKVAKKLGGAKESRERPNELTVVVDKLHVPSGLTTVNVGPGSYCWKYWNKESKTNAVISSNSKGGNGKSNVQETLTRQFDTSCSRVPVAENQPISEPEVKSKKRTRKTNINTTKKSDASGKVKIEHASNNPATKVSSPADIEDKTKHSIILPLKIKAKAETVGDPTSSDISMKLEGGEASERTSDRIEQNVAQLSTTVLGTMELKPPVEGKRSSRRETKEEDLNVMIKQPNVIAPTRSLRKATLEQRIPAKIVHSSVKKVTSSVKDVGIPLKNCKSVTSEVNNVGISSKSVETPTKDVGKPTKEIEMPYKKVKSSTIIVDSPAKKLNTPTKCVVKSVKKMEIPHKNAESPTKNVATSSDDIESYALGNENIAFNEITSTAEVLCNKIENFSTTTDSVNAATKTLTSSIKNLTETIEKANVLITSSCIRLAAATNPAVIAKENESGSNHKSSEIKKEIDLALDSKPQFTKDLSLSNKRKRQLSKIMDETPVPVNEDNKMVNLRRRSSDRSTSKSHNQSSPSKKSSKNYECEEDTLPSIVLRRIPLPRKVNSRLSFRIEDLDLPLKLRKDSMLRKRTKILALDSDENCAEAESGTKPVKVRKTVVAPSSKSGTILPNQETSKKMHVSNSSLNVIETSGLNVTKTTVERNIPASLEYTAPKTVKTANAKKSSCKKSKTAPVNRNVKSAKNSPTTPDRKNPDPVEKVPKPGKIRASVVNKFSGDAKKSFASGVVKKSSISVKKTKVVSKKGTAPVKKTKVLVNKRSGAIVKKTMGNRKT